MERFTEHMNGTPVPEAARSVELPVCPECGLVGKQPGGARTSYACTGPAGASHKRTSMKLVEYRAVG